MARNILVVASLLVLLVLVLPALIEPPARDTAERANAAALATTLAKAVEKYHREVGEWPEGDLAEMVKALRGDNDLNIDFLEMPAENFNEYGELIDPWGTPYLVEIDRKRGRANVRSAGPDRHFQLTDNRNDDAVTESGGIPGLPF